MEIRSFLSRKIWFSFEKCIDKICVSWYNNTYEYRMIDYVYSVKNLSVSFGGAGGNEAGFRRLPYEHRRMNWCKSSHSGLADIFCPGKDQSIGGMAQLPAQSIWQINSYTAAALKYLHYLYVSLL